MAIRKETPITVTRVNKFSTKIRVRERKDDYLKLFHVAYDLIIRKYDIKHNDLGMILFLYSEAIFTHTNIVEYGMVMPFNRRRVARLVQEGYIVAWAAPTDRRKSLYTLSEQSKTIVRTFYGLLTGDIPFSENPKLKKIVRTSNAREKFYKIGVRKINRKIEKENKQK
jgi:DNA-binding MarR family transcriptional regulator